MTSMTSIDNQLHKIYLHLDILPLSAFLFGFNIAFWHTAHYIFASLACIGIEGIACFIPFHIDMSEVILFRYAHGQDYATSTETSF